MSEVPPHALVTDAFRKFSEVRERCGQPFFVYARLCTYTRSMLEAARNAVLHLIKQTHHNRNSP